MHTGPEGPLSTIATNRLIILLVLHLVTNTRASAIDVFMGIYSVIIDNWGRTETQKNRVNEYKPPYTKSTRNRMYCMARLQSASCVYSNNL